MWHFHYFLTFQKLNYFIGWGNLFPRKTDFVIICSPNGILKDVTKLHSWKKKKKKNEYGEVNIQQTGIMLPPWPVSATTERTALLIFSCVLSFSSRLHPWEVSAKLTCFFLLLLFNRLLDLTFYFNVRHGLQRKIAYLLPPTVLMLFLLSVTGKHFNSYIKNHVARIIMCMFAHIKYMQNNISRQVVTLLNLAQCCALPVSSHLSPLY